LVEYIAEGFSKKRSYEFDESYGDKDSRGVLELMN
jgi:hypothetical protein